MSTRRRISVLISGVLVAGVVAFAVGPQAVLAQEATQSPEARARSFVDLMAGGQYAQAFELFTPQMKAAMPVDRLSATWNGLTAQAGPFQRQIATSIVPRGVLSVVVVTCAFERATFDVHVTVNPANLVGGLAVRPAVQAVTYAPPAYASPAAYKESEVTVGTGQWALPATLTMPVAPGPVPAVVLVHGSGPGDRDATVGQIKQFKDLALGLASRGIAVLRYDKRTRVHAQPDARPARSHRQGRNDRRRDRGSAAAQKHLGRRSESDRRARPQPGRNARAPDRCRRTAGCRLRRDGRRGATHSRRRSSSRRDISPKRTVLSAPRNKRRSVRSNR